MTLPENRKTILDCGCIHNPKQWLHMCPKHKVECGALHALAKKEHEQQRLRTGAVGVETKP